jgi:hypothetical protein
MKINRQKMAAYHQNLPVELTLHEHQRYYINGIKHNIRYHSRDVIYPVLKGSDFVKRRGSPFNKTIAL